MSFLRGRGRGRGEGGSGRWGGEGVSGGGTRMGCVFIHDGHLRVCIMWCPFICY